MLSLGWGAQKKSLASFWDGPHKSVGHGYEAFSSWLSHHCPLLIYTRKISVQTLRSAHSHLGAMLAKTARTIIITLFQSTFSSLEAPPKYPPLSGGRKKGCPNLAVHSQSRDKPGTSPAPKFPEVLSTCSAPTTTQAPVPALAFGERRRRYLPLEDSSSRFLICGL